MSPSGSSCWHTPTSSSFKRSLCTMETLFRSKCMSNTRTDTLCTRLFCNQSSSTELSMGRASNSLYCWFFAVWDRSDCNCTQWHTKLSGLTSKSNLICCGKSCTNCRRNSQNKSPCSRSSCIALTAHLFHSDSNSNIVKFVRIQSNYRSQSSVKNPGGMSLC